MSDVLVVNSFGQIKEGVQIIHADDEISWVIKVLALSPTTPSSVSMAFYHSIDDYETNIVGTHFSSTTVSIANTQLTFPVMSGLSSGVSYKLVCKFTSSDGDIRNVEIKIHAK